MDYARSYANATSLAERIRGAAQMGKREKPSGGLAAREQRRKDDLEVPSFEEIRAQYVNLVQDMFRPTEPSEDEILEIEDFIAEAEKPRPQRNPRNFATDVSAGNLSERDLLAMTLEAEAGGEGAKGMLAAGAVIANRVNADGYGNTFSEVILAPGQFSAWNSLTGYAGGEGGLDMSSLRASETAYRVADQILSGNYESPVGGATHYYNPNVADPDWGKRGGGQWQTIGNHVFGYGN